MGRQIHQLSSGDVPKPQLPKIFGAAQTAHRITILPKLSCPRLFRAAQTAHPITMLPKLSCPRSFRAAQTAHRMAAALKICNFYVFSKILWSRWHSHPMGRLPRFEYCAPFTIIQSNIFGDFFFAKRMPLSVIHLLLDCHPFTLMKILTVN